MKVYVSSQSMFRFKCLDDDTFTRSLFEQSELESFRNIIHMPEARSDNVTLKRSFANIDDHDIISSSPNVKKRRVQKTVVKKDLVLSTRRIRSWVILIYINS